MESWASKKKRSKRDHSNKSFYEELPKDLQTNILNRLTKEELSSAMLVSKSWCQLILLTCLPMIVSVTIPLLKLLRGVESKAKREIPACWVSVFADTLTLYPYVGLTKLVKWCLRLADCRFATGKLVDSCNGLLLFCRKSNIENFACKVYHYYVINPITKRCVAVLKPRPSTVAYVFLALAYDPAESEFFKIIGFQGLRHASVFSSRTSSWSILNFQLPPEVNAVSWSKTSIYLKGAVYRLSSSEHLVKLFVGRQRNPKNQALAIKFPCSCSSHRDIGLRHRKVVFFTFVGHCLTIWELVEHFERGAYTFDWLQTHKVMDMFLLNLDGQLLTLHPHYAIAFFKYKRIIYYYFYSPNTMASDVLEEFVGPILSYTTSAGFLLLEYCIPRNFNKKRPEDFKWLPTMKNGRQVAAYTLEN